MHMVVKNMNFCKTINKKEFQNSLILAWAPCHFTLPMRTNFIFLYVTIWFAIVHCMHSAWLGTTGDDVMTPRKKMGTNKSKNWYVESWLQLENSGVKHMFVWGIKKCPNTSMKFAPIIGFWKTWTWFGLKSTLGLRNYVQLTFCQYPL